MERDCAQFIRFNDFKDSPGALIREIMKEIPKQLVQYFRNAGIEPGPKKDLNESEITFESTLKSNDTLKK